MTSSPDLPLSALLRNLDEAAALARAREDLASGVDPVAIMQACQDGMLEVGRLYECGEYYLSGLIMAGEILREITEILQPALEGRPRPAEAGTVLLGTVRGDIHDIGKNMVGMLLRCNGFAVVDLGVDVSPDEFLASARQVRPDVIGLSGLLTVAYDAMKETVAVLRAASEAAGETPIVIGGGLVTEQVNRYVGANYWARDAVTGLQLCRSLCRGGRAAASAPR